MNAQVFGQSPSLLGFFCIHLWQVNSGLGHASFGLRQSLGLLVSQPAQLQNNVRSSAPQARGGPRFPRISKQQQPQKPNTSSKRTNFQPIPANNHPFDMIRHPCLFKPTPDETRPSPRRWGPRRPDEADAVPGRAAAWRVGSGNRRHVEQNERSCGMVFNHAGIRSCGEY